MDLKGGAMTLEILKQYNAADLDPYTVQLGQRLCERFRLSKIGYQNLSDTFGSLPGIQVFEQNFEAGYGRQHPVPSVIASDSGSVLAAIVGSLAECFTEKVVVEFLVLLTKRSNTPRASQPTPQQWRRLVDIFFGILMPSTFGLLVTNIAAFCPPLTAEPDAERLLNALDKMSDRAQRRSDGKRAEILEADGESVYLTAVSSWLFGLDTTISTISNDVIYSSSNGERNSSIEIQLMPHRVVSTRIENFRLSPTPQAISKTKQKPPNSNVTTVDITGGRVSFERLFATCFRDSFQPTVSGDAISSIICCASNIIHLSRQHDTRKLSTSFLPQPAAKNESDRHSLKETLFAWFPEIRRLSPKCDKYARLNLTDSKAQLERAAGELQKGCRCVICSGSGSRSTECRFLISWMVIKMGLSVSRIVLSPKVFPKQSGVAALYSDCWRLFQDWKDSGTSFSASEYLTYHMLGILPRPTELLKTACMLFTSGNPAAHLGPEAEVMGVSYRGFAIFLTGFGPLGTLDTKTSPQTSTVSIRVMPGWMCPFGHEMKLEIYDPALLGATFNECWDTVLTHGDKNIGQILKRQEDVVLTSIVHKGTQLEEQAKLEGWLLVDDNIGG